MYTKFRVWELVCSFLIIGAIKDTKALPTNYTNNEPTDFQGTWSREIVLSEELNIKLKMSFDDPQGILMQLSGPSKGVMGIGFSPNGQLDGSDMIIGWLDYWGAIHARDTHVIQGEPIEDVEQNHELVHAQTNENGDELILLLRLPWDNCGDEENDRRIMNGVHRLVWTYSASAPYSSSANDVTSSEWTGQENWSGFFETDILVPLEALKECPSGVQSRKKRSPQLRCHCKCCECSPYCPSPLIFSRSRNVNRHWH